MKRKIIEIDENLCNGCGRCVPGCPEGALQMIDGKARMVAEYFCDGLGACIGECPQGAITVVEREAEAYDEKRTMLNIIAKGENTIKAHLKHLFAHGEKQLLLEALEVLRESGINIPDYKSGVALPGKEMKTGENTGAEKMSFLGNWPVQMKLVSPLAPFLKGAHLLFAADCTAFAYGNFHEDFMRGRIGIILCPKLDNSAEEYIVKASEIIKNNDVKSVTVVRMQVPCCGGITHIVNEAVRRSGVNIYVNEIVISVDGKIIK